MEIRKHAELASGLEVELLGLDGVESACLAVMVEMHVDDHSSEGGVYVTTEVVDGLVHSDQIDQSMLIGGRGTIIHREKGVVGEQYCGNSRYQEQERKQRAI